jgi:hypothetical protein
MQNFLPARGAGSAGRCGTTMAKCSPSHEQQGLAPNIVLRQQRNRSTT